jgi:protein phosphatase methylesterase 1
MEPFKDYVDVARDGEDATPPLNLRVYIDGTGSESGLCLLLLHGAGSCAQTWHNQCLQFREAAMLMAPDMRSHGASSMSEDMSIEALVSDVEFIISAMRGRVGGRRIIMVGHSLGGSIAAKLVSASSDPKIAGLVVLDVAEATVINSLSKMDSILASWPDSFDSEEAYAQWCSRCCRPQSLASARVSTPPLIAPGEDGRYRPRYDLKNSKPYWVGWFEGFDAAFLSTKVPKLIVLSHIDVLDRDLTVAHMGGAFMLQVMTSPFRSHFFQEDSADELLHILLDFFKKKNFLTEDDSLRFLSSSYARMQSVLNFPHQSVKTHSL